MSSPVMPNVRIIGNTVLDFNEIAAWLSNLGAENFKAPTDEDPGATLVMLAGKRCYMSFEKELNANLTRTTESLVKYIDNILNQGHGSVLEHVSYNFAIENISRILTAELNRHRAGAAISEGSMRYIRFNEDIRWVMPNSIAYQDGDTPEENKKRLATELLFYEVFNFIEDKYERLTKIWDIDSIKDFHTKKILTSMFRRIVPMGVATGGIWTFNLRAIRHICTMRCSPGAEEEIIDVATQMLTLMREREILLFKDFKKVKGYWEPKYKKV